MARLRLYVTLYEVSRDYGGPEEGGWWYDWWTPVKTFKARDDRHAERLRDRLQKQHPITRPRRWESWGDVDPIVMIETERRSMLRDCRPHYE
jgi:hypothetical protein